MFLLPLKLPPEGEPWLILNNDISPLGETKRG